MTDAECRQLLQLLHKYVMEEISDSMTVPDLASDLAMSLDPTTDEDDRMRKEIEQAYAH